MVRAVVLAFAASLALASAWDISRNSRAFLGLRADLQPAVVAKTLSRVEEEWKTEAESFIECELSESTKDQLKDCDGTPHSFKKSCSTVVGAIVQGSSGKSGVMMEYMDDVCGQKSMANWHQEACNSLAKSIHIKMTASSYDNRNLETEKICDDFWSNFLVEQRSLHDKEVRILKEIEKKAEAKADQQEKEAEAEDVRARKEKETAEKHSEDAKEQAEIETEKEMVDQRAQKKKQAEKLDKREAAQEAEIEAVEKEADAKIAEATKEEQDVVVLDGSAKTAATQQNKEVVKPTKEAAQPKKEESVKPAKAAAPVVQTQAAKAIEKKAVVAVSKPLDAKAPAASQPAAAKTPAASKTTDTKAPAASKAPVASKVGAVKA